MAEIGRVAGDLQLGNRRAAVRAPALMRDYCEVPPENRTGCDSAGSLGVVCIQASELVAEGCSEAAAALLAGEWVQRPDVAGRMGWERVEVKQSQRWWADPKFLDF